MSEQNFFITTPIYYTNGIPHIGHWYSSIIADIIARYKKINWKNIKFSTWVDENSQKIVEKAKQENIEISEYLDIMAQKHKLVWKWLNIEYTDFIRTTDKKHHNFVKQVLQKSFDNWDIYKWSYEWMYCIWCEAFKKDNDLIEKNWKMLCPYHLKIPDKIKEQNYFFKLSKYQDFLEDFYKNNPEFIIPNNRFNEVKAFVSRWLEDFSISRETNKFGIKLPFDNSQVTYVWYDALFNYLTVCQDNMDFWPADLHVVWKDIIRFHWIYWPAMLKSAWYKIPKQILTTWFFTVDWQKISKSLWNAINPVEFSEKYSKDLLVLYLLSSFNIWQDWNFDKKEAILTYNAKLANNFGNLVNRVIVLSLKIWWKLEWKINTKLLDEYINNFNKNLNDYCLKQALDSSFKFLDDLNKNIDEQKPWELVKNNIDKASQVLYFLAEWLRQVWLNLYCFFPEKMWEMFIKLWFQNYITQLQEWKLQKLRDKKEIFHIKEKKDNLFNRIEI